jgi:hypothetical protein
MIKDSCSLQPAATTHLQLLCAMYAIISRLCNGLGGDIQLNASQLVIEGSSDV